MLTGIVAFSFSCKTKKETTKDGLFPKLTYDSESNETNYFVTECDSIPINWYFGYDRKRFETITFADSTILFCSPNEQSKVLGFVPINTRLLGNISVKNNKELWLQIQHENKIGFIRKTDVFQSLIVHWNTDVLAGKLNKEVMGVKAINEIDKFPQTSFAFSDSLKKDLKASEERNTQFINGIAFSHKDLLVRHTVSKTFEKEKSETNEFVLLLGNNQFIPICKSKSEFYNRFYSDNSNQVENYYFPMKFKDERILWVKNGDLANIFNSKTGLLETVDPPKEITENLETLIILKKESFHISLDPDYGEVMLDDEGYEIWITEVSYQYYHWKLNKLVSMEL